MTSMALLQLFWHFTNWQSSSSNYPVKRRLGNLHLCFSWLVLISPFDLKKKAKSTVYLTSNIMNNYCSEVMQTKNQAPDKVWIYLTFNGNFETFQWPLNAYLILYSLSLSLSNTDTHTHTHTCMHTYRACLLTWNYIQNQVTHENWTNGNGTNFAKHTCIPNQNMPTVSSKHHSLRTKPPMPTNVLGVYSKLLGLQLHITVHSKWEFDCWTRTVPSWHLMLPLLPSPPLF